MKNIRILVLVALVGTVGGLHAQTVIDSGYCGANGDTNLTWKLTSDNTLTISGSGAMNDYEAYYLSYYAPWYPYCMAISTVVIDSGVTSIGNKAFYGCEYLSSVTIPNSVTIIGEGAFGGCAWRLNSVTLPNSVTSIEKETFRGCENLISITLPSSLISIGVRAFSGCYRLQSITLPNSLISIGDFAFVGCYKFTSVTIPAAVATIGHFAFGGCRILTSINVDSNNQRYSSINGIVYNKLQDTLILCPQAKGGQVIIPNSVTVIGDNAFSYCENLISVAIPNSVIIIGNEAFTYCDYLMTVALPNSVTTIGDLAFWGCNRFDYIIIPNSVTSIGDYAFECSGLTFVICNAIIPPASGKNIFGYSCPIYIPCFTYNSYSNASGWSQYSNNFVINGNLTADTTFYSAAICHGASYTDQNFTTPISLAGVYYATLANSRNCDSIICLYLTEYPFLTNYSESICQGNTYTDANFTNLTQAGTYYDTLQTVNGCDSIIELILTVNPKQDTVIFSDTIYYGGSYTQNGFNITNVTKDSIYFNNNLNINNCDSVTQLILKITGVGIVETHCNASLRVYPNPTTGKLAIETKGEHAGSPLQIEIYDVVGQNVGANLRVRPDGVIIDISHLANGIYFLKINNKTIKIIKQ